MTSSPVISKKGLMKDVGVEIIPSSGESDDEEEELGRAESTLLDGDTMKKKSLVVLNRLCSMVISTRHVQNAEAKRFLLPLQPLLLAIRRIVTL